jgi:hypothetical protein
MNTVQVRHSKTGEYVLIDLDKCTLLGASEEPFADVPIVTNLEPPHYIDCPTEIQATWRHKHYLARPSRRKYANSPSVPHSFIKAWFGPTVYYARPSRRAREISVQYGFDDDNNDYPKVRELDASMFHIGKPTFKGYDWTELLDAFGLPHTDENDDDLKTITSYLWSPKYDPDPTLKAFLQALIDADCSGWSPLWEGLLKIGREGDQETFRQIFIILLPNMWT